MQASTEIPPFMRDVGNHDESFELKGNWILLESKKKSVKELLEEKRRPGTLTYSAEKESIIIKIENLPHDLYFRPAPLLGMLGITQRGPRIPLWLCGDGKAE